MVNLILFKSVLCTILPFNIVYTLYFFNYYHSLLNILVLLTSLLNHGYTNPIFVRIDRSVIWFVGIINIFLYPEVNILLGLLSIFLYRLSLKLKSNLFHIILHIVGVLSNISIIYKNNI